MVNPSAIFILIMLRILAALSLFLTGLLVASAFLFPTRSPQVTARTAPPTTPQPTATFWQFPSPRPTATPSTTLSPLPTLTRTPTATPTLTRTRRPTFTPGPTATPRRAPPIVIGQSVAGRPLEVYQFGTGALGRMIVAGIHGANEYNTIALADELINELTVRPSQVPPEVTLYILRSLNPDGEARGREAWLNGTPAPPFGRANEHRVDLNRNWPSVWQAEWDRTGCWNLLRLNGGHGPGSEPETQALMNFLLVHTEIDALINYHSAALGIFPGGQPPDANSLDLADAVDAVSRYPYPPIDTGCKFSGQLIDWASEQGIAALDIELSNHRDSDLNQNLAILRVLLEWRRLE